MYFLITIDTEGDNIWQRPSQVTTENARFLPRFQTLCERYGFRPTYLTNYEMAVCPVYQEFARDVLARDSAELGMHLHAWNSPPGFDLTGDDFTHQPYLVEYPPEQVEAKVTFMTSLLTQIFGIKATSHRAGRWAFNAHYAGILQRLGYRVDCSVTPGVDWRQHPGAPAGAGGTDYRAFPNRPYFLDPEDISCATNSGLLELPMTIHARYSPWVAALRRRWNSFKGRQRHEAMDWFRPTGRNLDSLKRIAQKERQRGAAYLEFMLHSSELMPGGSPTFPDAESIEKLYQDMEQLFACCAEFCQGATLTEFADIYSA